jgi:hypothetical protein
MASSELSPETQLVIASLRADILDHHEAHEKKCLDEAAALTDLAECRELLRQIISKLEEGYGLARISLTTPLHLQPLWDSLSKGGDA